MTTGTPSSRNAVTAARALWFAVLAMLLALQSATGLAHGPERGDGGVQTLRIVAAVPPAAQLREGGKLVQSAARAIAPKAQGGGHAGDPPLAAHALMLAMSRWDTCSGPSPARRAMPRVDRPADRYSARAPPAVA